MAKKNISVGVEIDGSAKGFKSASEDAQKASQKLAISTGKNTKKMGGFFGKLGDSVNSIGGKVGGLMRTIASGISGAMKMLMANPIIAAITAIIAAIVGLVKIIKSTDSGMTEWNVRMEQLRATMDQLRQRVLQLAGAMKHLFKGEFKEAAEAAKDAVTGVGDAMKEATSAAREYVEAMDNIQNSQDNFISKAAQMEFEIEKLRFTAEDASKEGSLRLAAANQASKLIMDLARMRADFAQKEFDEQVKYLAKKSGLTKKEIDTYINMSDEERKVAGEKFDNFYNLYEGEIIEIEKKSAAVFTALKEEFSRGKELNNQKNSLIKELAATEEKARQDKKIEDEKDLKKSEEDAEKEKDLIERQTDTLRTVTNEISALKKEGYNKDLELLKQAQEEELRNTELTEAAKLGIAEKYKLLLANLDEEYRLKRIADQATSDAEGEKSRQKEIADQQAKYDAIAEFAQTSLDLVNSIMNVSKQKELKAAGDNAKKKEEIERKYARRQKGIAITQALINGALAITKALAQTGVLAPFVLPTIIAATLAQVATISAQKFATGGIVSGPTMGMVGEYAGAKNNPEVIAPLDKLKGLLNTDSGGGEVIFRIEGTTLVGVLDNQLNKQASYS